MSWPDGSDHYYQIFERMAMNEVKELIKAAIGQQSL